MTSLKRKLYRRGNSYETTLPRPMLFGLNSNKKYNVVFKFKDNEWYIEFEEVK